MANLNVSSKKIINLLGNQDMQEKYFIIPEYQRPYRWDTEKCAVLWSDIVDFRQSSTGKNEEYFLGTIVVCPNEKGNLEVIDGQQRLTSLLLLLRAFYRVLEQTESTPDTAAKITTLKSKIAPCIWDVDVLTAEITDRTAIRLHTQVATETDNEILHEILANGEISEECRSNYAVNYLYFLKQCQEYARTNPMDWYHLCLTILNDCILLPIESDSLNSALTIFSTLNDRGLPLSDADIFKARLYKMAQQKDKFVEQWKELVALAEGASISVDDLFRYYTHVLRAKEKITDKEIGLRRFYTDNRNKQLENENLFNHLIELAGFWQDINNSKTNQDVETSNFVNDEAAKWLQCLNVYPNEFWKYAASVFFIANKGAQSFKDDFAALLKQLTAFLYAKFLVAPTVTSIKDDIYKLCVAIYHGEKNALSYVMPAPIHYEQNTGRITKGLLMINAYLFDEKQKLLPTKTEIEHIFPKKWQETNYNGWSIIDAEQYLEQLGNKIVFEKRLNIQAGNGYFGKKKEQYQKSDIVEVRELAGENANDWLPSDIQKRQQQIVDRLKQFFDNCFEAASIPKKN
ncbi:DUF262 domain-containing protein [Neisseria meningitidis]|uniref:DUF262 domain-containing protein n=1 Tax=Neisseria meningitidis TaxID=487 RepID=UPI001C5B51A2|nr:DUF262 domain-containing protein [Neisseria meningitidis]MBW3940668.1 DUF262 domain-containing protein [Neisseria meningitidis]